MPIGLLILAPKQGMRVATWCTVVFHPTFQKWQRVIPGSFCKTYSSFTHFCLFYSVWSKIFCVQTCVFHSGIVASHSCTISPLMVCMCRELLLLFPTLFFINSNSAIIGTTYNVPGFACQRLKRILHSVKYSGVQHVMLLNKK